MKTEDFGVDLARHLYAAERALDQAIASAAELSSAMTRGRIKHRIAAEVGQDALLGVGQLVGNLASQRQLLIDAHRGLKRDAENLNIGWQAIGPERKPDVDGPVFPPSGLLKVVA